MLSVFYHPHFEFIFLGAFFRRFASGMGEWGERFIQQVTFFLVNVMCSFKTRKWLAEHAGDA